VEKAVPVAVSELVLRVSFPVVCYLAVAYNVEKLRKESYFGREA
jgi:hypothetical protein